MSRSYITSRHTHSMHTKNSDTLFLNGLCLWGLVYREVYIGQLDFRSYLSKHLCYHYSVIFATVVLEKLFVITKLSLWLLFLNSIPSSFVTSFTPTCFQILHPIFISKKMFIIHIPRQRPPPNQFFHVFPPLILRTRRAHSYATYLPNGKYTHTHLTRAPYKQTHIRFSNNFYFSIIIN